MKETVKESMTKEVVSIDWNEELVEAYRIMQSHRIRHLPVLDDEGIVVGILSDRDILRAMSSKPGEKEVFPKGAKAKTYMSWPVKTFDKDRPLKEVAKEMLRDKISSLLVTDSKKNIVGIITTDDLLRVLIELLNESGPGFIWNLEDLIKAPFRQAYS